MFRCYPGWRSFSHRALLTGATPGAGTRSTEADDLSARDRAIATTAGGLCDVEFCPHEVAVWTVSTPPARYLLHEE
jgi:hypothetical protein